MTGMNRFYYIDFFIFAPLALFISWPPRLAEFGSPLFIAVLLMAGIMAWLPRAFPRSERAPLLARQFKGLLILATSAYLISWLIPLSDYEASLISGMAGELHSFSRILDHVYTGVLWMVFPWLSWITLLVLLGSDRQINRN